MTPTARWPPPAASTPTSSPPCSTSPGSTTPPPKSLDRNAWDTAPARGLSPADGAATLTAFTAETVRLALGHVPPLARLMVTGGGRLNPVLMREIEARTGVPTGPGGGRRLERRRAGGRSLCLDGGAQRRRPADQLARNNRRAGAHDRRPPRLIPA